MKVLLAFCGLFAATQAGLIHYPLHTTYLQAPVIHTNKLGAGFAYTTLGHPFLRSHVGLTYTGYPLAYPSFYSPSLYPGAYWAPPVVQLVPALPANPDAKKDEKPTEAPAEGSTEASKPEDAENIDSSENKEEEEPKPSEESAQSDDSISVDSA